MIFCTAFKIYVRTTKLKKEYTHTKRHRIQLTATLDYVLFSAAQLETHRRTARMYAYLKLLSNDTHILYVQIAANRDIRIKPQDSPARNKFDMFSYLKI